MHVAAGIEQSAHSLDVSGPCSEMQRICVVSRVARVRIRVVLEEQPYGVHVPAAGGSVEPGPCIAILLTCTSQARIVHEQAAQDLDVAFGTGLEEHVNRLCLPPIYFSLQCTPA